MLDVGTGLLCHNVPAPELNALNEATVAAIYKSAWHCTLFEIDNDEMLDEIPPKYKTWRELILANLTLPTTVRTIHFQTLAIAIRMSGRL